MNTFKQAISKLANIQKLSNDVTRISLWYPIITLYSVMRIHTLWSNFPQMIKKWYFSDVEHIASLYLYNITTLDKKKSVHHSVLIMKFVYGHELEIHAPQSFVCLFQAHNMRRIHLMNSSLKSRKEKGAQHEEICQSRFKKRYNEKQRLDHEDSLKFFQVQSRIVNYYVFLQVLNSQPYYTEKIFLLWGGGGILWKIHM